MAKKKKTKLLLNINSDAFVQGVGERPSPGNLRLIQLFKEVIQNTLSLDDLPKYRYPLRPEWEQVRATLTKRNDLLYQEIDRRE